MFPALGCDSTSVSTSTGDLIGWKWVFEEAQLPDGSLYFLPHSGRPEDTWWIHFDDADYVTGWEACNECRGQFTADDDGILEFDLGGCTESLCGPSGWYKGYWHTMRSVTRFQIRIGKLLLYYKLNDGRDRVLIHKRTRCSWTNNPVGRRLCC